MELNMKNMENEKRELVSLCARLATDSHNYMNAAKNAVKEYKILISNN